MKNLAIIGLVLCITACDKAPQTTNQPNDAVSQNLSDTTSTINTKDPKNIQDVATGLKDTELKDLPENETWQALERNTQNYLGDNPSDEKINHYLQLEAKSIKKSLPADMGDGVTLTDVTVGNKSLVYDYKVNEAIDKNVDTAVVKKNLLEQGELCKSMGFIFKYGVKLTYHYHGNNNESFSLDFSPQDCS